MGKERQKSVGSTLAMSALKKATFTLSVIALNAFGTQAQNDNDKRATFNDKAKAKTEATNKAAVPDSVIVEGSGGIAEGVSMRNPDFFVINLHAYQENDPNGEWSKSTQEYAEELYLTMTDPDSPYRIAPKKIKVFTYEIAEPGYTTAVVQLDGDMIAYGKVKGFHPLDMIKNAKYFQKAYYDKHGIKALVASSGGSDQLNQREPQ